MIRAVAYTGGRCDPSARFRIRQYIEPLLGLGVELKEYPAPLGAYPPASHALRPFWAVAAVAARLPSILLSHNAQVTVFQRQLLSTFLTLETLGKSPRLLDVDDAIWLHQRAKSVQRLAESSDGVICGNAFLAETLRNWNQNVCVLPTAIDTNRYCPLETSTARGEVIGWSGSAGNLRYLYSIERALSEVLARNPGVSLSVVCDQMPRFSHIPRDRFSFIPWSPRLEVEALQGMTIGIMPLDDSEWARGKCALKMIAYMACGLPVVVSPVGANLEILKKGSVGFGAATHDEWVDSLDWLVRNPGTGRAYGADGRRVVLQDYSVAGLAPIFAGVLKSFAAPGLKSNNYEPNPLRVVNKPNR
jgi:Glycosyl transferases group 1